MLQKELEKVGAREEKRINGNAWKKMRDSSQATNRRENKDIERMLERNLISKPSKDKKV